MHIIGGWGGGERDGKAWEGRKDGDIGDGSSLIITLTSREKLSFSAWPNLIQTPWDACA